MALEELGWDPGWAALMPCARGTEPAAGGSPAGERRWGDLSPGRVVRVDRGRCLVLTATGAVSASFGSALLEAWARDPVSAPCTGDWCVLRSWPDGPLTVETVLARRTAVVRADVKGSSRGQVLAANVDVVGVVVGLVPEPVVARVERLVTLAWASGSTPAIVLTKSDLVPDAAMVAADLSAAAPGVEVLVCSTVTGEGIDSVRALLSGGRTMGLVGSSGAGKSSLVNALAGGAVQLTREIRADGRGRHTTVRRELVPVPGGGALVDTPGMRGLGLVEAEEGLASTFTDIESFSDDCRFRDCSHAGEPGCEVLAAVEDGRLPVRRLESWRKLGREMEWMAARSDARLRAERAKVWRQRARERRRTRPSGS